MGEVKFRRVMYEVTEDGVTKTVYLLDEKLKINTEGNKEKEELETELFDYVNWYNNFRIHGSLNYLTPIQYKKMSL